MARPRKIGFNSFPHDTNAANDDKMQAFRALHGNDGYAFYFIVCEHIYRYGATVDMEDADTVQLLAQNVMVTVERFFELLESSIELGLFLIQDYAITNDDILRTAISEDVKRQRWQRSNRKRAINSAVNEINSAVNQQNTDFPTRTKEDELTELTARLNELTARLNEPEVVSSIGFKKDLSSLKDFKDQDLNTLPSLPRVREAPPPFEYEGKLDILKAMNHYGVKLHGFLKFDMIRSYQGVMDDEILLAAIKESGGRTDSYCSAVVSSWFERGWHKMADHPSYQGGEVVEIARGRIERQRPNARTATQIAFEEAGKRSKPGRQVWTPR